MGSQIKCENQSQTLDIEERIMYESQNLDIEEEICTKVKR